MTSTCQLTPKPVNRNRYPLPPTVESLTAFIDDRFDGKMEEGAHKPGNCACVMEAVSAYMEIGWTDNPVNVWMFNLRPLNDIAGVPAELRAKWMIRLSVAYWGSMNWPENKQQAVVEKIVRGTVNRVTTKLPGMTDKMQEKCKTANTVATGAAVAAWVAARAADDAGAASEEFFVTACQVWLDAANQAG